MAGLTPTGLVIKTLPEVINGLKEEARDIYADLVPEGDVVNTEDDAGLGRLIGVVSPSQADIWEAIQQIHDAFTPTAATGIALDNLVALGGLERSPSSSSVAYCLFTGTPNTLLEISNKVRSPVSGKVFSLLRPVPLSAASCSGFTAEVLTVQAATDYTVSYTVNAVTNTITYTSTGSPTELEILAGLEAEITSSHPALVATVEAGGVLVIKADVYQTMSVVTSANLGLTAVTVLGQVIADETGPQQQSPNSITQIVTPLLGWDSVTNPAAATPGRNIETDEELRERFRNSKFERATGSVDAIYSGIINTEGVVEVKIYENDTNITDSNGVPPHSFLPIVIGGETFQVGTAIWQNKPIGILSVGNTSVVITDVQGFPHTVSFERPAVVDIYISIDITKFSDFPADGEDKIKSSIAAYFSDNLGIGDEVVYSRLYTPINSVPGHQVNSLTIGTSPSPVGMSNIPIDFNNIAGINTVNIVITET